MVPLNKRLSELSNESLRMEVELEILRRLAQAVRERESLHAQEIADEHKEWKKWHGGSE